MANRDPEQLNNKDDLVDVKALVRDAEPGSFTLEDILAEYGTKREPEPEAVPRRIVPQPKPQEPEKGKVVAFPGTRTAPAPEPPDGRRMSRKRRTGSLSPLPTGVRRTRTRRPRSPTTGWWNFRRRRASCPRS